MLRFPHDGSDSPVSKKSTMKLPGVFDLKTLQTHGVSISTTLSTNTAFFVFDVGDRFAVKVHGKNRRVFVRAVAKSSTNCSCGLCVPDETILLKKACKPC